MTATEPNYKKKWRVLPLRRAVQMAVLGLLVAIPFLSQNPVSLPPSRIVLGHLPPPSTFPLSGDTWSLGIGELQFTHPVAFIETWLSTKVLYLPLLVSVLLPLGVTLLLGRVFCSWLCPIGFFLEMNMALNRFMVKRKVHLHLPIRDFRYPLLVICLAMSFVFAFPVIGAFDPPHLFGREIMFWATHQQVSLFGVSFLLVIFFLEILTVSRLWCRFGCPSGGALALLGSWRPWGIRMQEERCNSCGDCNGVCPYALNPMGLSMGIPLDWKTCDNCGLCRDVCPVGAISYSFACREKPVKTGAGG